MAQKYNLRSRKKETVLPVQIQLCDDQDFMSQVLGGSHPTPAQRQVNSDLSSGSNFDIWHLVQSSDTETDVPHTEHRSYDRFNSESQVPDDKNASSTQQMVNQTILENLEKISARLDTLEQKNCKKSVQASKIKNKTKSQNKMWNWPVHLVQLMHCLGANQCMRPVVMAKKQKPRSHMPRLSRLSRSDPTLQYLPSKL